MKKSSLNEQLNAALQTLDFERGETCNGKPTRLIRYRTVRDNDCGAGRGARPLAWGCIRLPFDTARNCGYRPAGLALKMVEGDPLDDATLRQHYRRLFGSETAFAPILTDEFIEAFANPTSSRADISRALAGVRRKIQENWVHLSSDCNDFNKTLRKATLDALRCAEVAPGLVGRRVQWVKLQNSPDTSAWTSARRLVPA